MTTNHEITLHVVADSPEQLRVIDIERLIYVADQTGHLDEFVKWINGQNISDRARRAIAAEVDAYKAEQGDAIEN